MQQSKFKIAYRKTIKVLKSTFASLLFSFLISCNSVWNDASQHELNVEISDTIVLQENKIGNLTLSPNKVKTALLQNNFPEFVINKEIGQQDGPDFQLFSVNYKNEELFFFKMNDEDTLKLDQVIIKHPIVKDEYGLKVGDSYQQIKNLRKGKVMHYTDLHQHTFVVVDASNIIYEIVGDAEIPEDADFEDIQFTEDQIKDWKIEYLIWRNN